MPTILGTDLFAHGDFTEPGGGGYQDVVGTPARDTTIVPPGNPCSLLLSAAGAGVEYVEYSFAGGTRGWRGFWWYMASADLPDTSTIWGQMWTPGFGSNGKFGYSVGSGLHFITVGDINFVSFAMSADEWHWIEQIFDVSGTTHTFYMRVDGVDQTPVDRTGLSASTVTIHELGFGAGGGNGHTHRFARGLYGSATSISDWLGEPETTIFFPSNAAADANLSANVDKALSIETPDGAETEKITNTAAGPSFLVMTDGAGAGEVWFVTPPLNAFSIGASDLFDAMVYAWESNVAANVRAQVQCYRLNRAGVVQGSQFVDWQLSGPGGTAELSTTTDTYQHAGSEGLSAVDFAQGDRLLFLIVGADGGGTMAAGHTFTTAYGTRVGAGGTFIVLPATITAEQAFGYQRVYGPARLGASAAHLYTVPDDTRIEIRSLDLNNPSGSLRKVTLSIGSDAAGTRVEELLDVPAGESLNLRRGFNHTLEEGEFLQGYADSADVVVASINAWIEQN